MGFLTLASYVVLLANLPKGKSDFPGFSYGRVPRVLWVPKVPRRKFHGLRAFGAFGTKSKGDQNKNKFDSKPSELPELPELPQLPHTKNKFQKEIPKSR